MTVTTDAVGDYFSRIGPLRVLDADEVADLAKRIQAAAAARDHLAGLADDHPDRDRLAAVVADGATARHRLVEHNLKLVPGVARRYRGHGVPFASLIQHGNLGLLKAVDRYDPSRGYRFATYAVWWIRQAVQRAVQTESRAVRVPVAVTELARTARAVEARLRIELGRDPTTVEVAAELDTDVDRLEAARLATRPVDSLDRRVGDDDSAGVTVGALLADPDAPDPTEVAEVADLPRQARLLLARLPQRERWTLERYYGLDRQPPWSDYQIADALQLSRAAAYNIRHQALQRLRHPANRSRARRAVA